MMMMMPIVGMQHAFINVIYQHRLTLLTEFGSRNDPWGEKDDKGKCHGKSKLQVQRTIHPTPSLINSRWRYKIETKRETKCS